jgi:hypothetical protein
MIKKINLTAQGVRNTPPSPTFGALLSPAKGLVEKEVCILEKNASLKSGSIHRDKGIEDRVSSKI